MEELDEERLRDLTIGDTNIIVAWQQPNDPRFFVQMSDQSFKVLHASGDFVSLGEMTIKGWQNVIASDDAPCVWTREERLLEEPFTIGDRIRCAIKE